MENFSVIIPPQQRTYLTKIIFAPLGSKPFLNDPITQQSLQVTIEAHCQIFTLRSIFYEYTPQQFF